jgi:hypothetical protein
LLNNQLVCALLLLVSLLTACSGTNGGGNTEVSMQSNGPLTNATSVPTAKANNPPLSAVNGVRVARWSRDPRGPIPSIPLSVVTLGIVNNCLVIINKDAPPTLPIFPYHNGVWDDAKRTFTYEGQVVRVGESIKVGVWSIQNFDYLKANGKYDVPDCGTTNFVVAP